MTTRGLRYGVPGALVACGLFLAVTGPRALAESLGAADPWLTALAVACGLGAALAWGASLWLALGAVGTPVSFAWGVLLFLAATFCNVVTPFGGPGGDATSATVVERVAGSDYETALAAIGSVNTVNRAASVGVGVVGLLLAAEVTLALVAVGACAVLAALGVLAWRRREALVPLAARPLTPLARAASYVLPGVGRPDRAAVAARVGRFLAAVGRLRQEPRRLVGVVALGVAGQGLVVATLWLSLRALGVPAPIALAAAVVPASKVGAAVPTPGGVGGVDLALVGLLGATTAVPPAVAGAAALAYRLASFGLPTVLGGAVTASVVGRSRASRE